MAEEPTEQNPADVLAAEQLHVQHMQEAADIVCGEVLTALADLEEDGMKILAMIVDRFEQELGRRA